MLEAGEGGVGAQVLTKLGGGLDGILWGGVSRSLTALISSVCCKGFSILISLEKLVISKEQVLGLTRPAMQANLAMPLVPML